MSTVDDCIFCKIASSKIKANIIYQDEDIVVFDDLNPKALYHKLIIPRKHFDTLNDIQDEDLLLVGKMFNVAKKVAFDLGIAEKGYRVLINCDEGGGQEIFHLHMHLLSGK